MRGKSVVVTGGGTGIGKGIVRALAQCGADVVVAGRRVELLESTVDEARSLGVRAVAARTDITSMDDLQNLADTAVSSFGKLDGWVNNAGSASNDDVGPLISIDEGQFDRVVDLNFKWTFFACQIAAKAMKNGGSILNISSRSGSNPSPNIGHYGAAKAGVENLTATMAVEWGHLGIRVNAIAPGMVMTETSASSTGSLRSEGRRQRQIETIPLRRLGNVDDVGPLAAFFLADESSWISGAIVPVNGGSRAGAGLHSYLHHINEKLKAEAEKTSA